MSTEEEKVRIATQKFYGAIGDMISGRGLDTMSEAWHHTDDVSGKHPSGEWAHGWHEVWATWQLLDAFGDPKHSGGGLMSLKVQVYGDIAYTMGQFEAAASWGGEQLMCTNVLRRIEGQWKIVHHHADPSPAMAAALDRMLQAQAG